MSMLFKFALFAALLSALALAQAGAVPQATHPGASLSEDQIRQLFRTTADHDMENDKKQRNYTYTERDVERRLDGKGQVK
ncbi:MAG TPA: hypothetical protein VET69_02045, partial [Terriglobales bacterium]|nr:hypothetical protein [Terriglobales bacterium]